jgi:ribosomal protein S18 acetylase RimI-like enzyme
MSALKSLRRATAEDLPAITALQRAAYAKNRSILGIEPLPLTVDYAEIFSSYEFWLCEGPAGLDGVLILEPRPDDLLIWSVASAPAAQGRGVGNRMLAAAEMRARQLGLTCLRLYTGDKLVGNIAWYGRHGYVQERVEQREDRRLVHMVKRLDGER